MKKLILSAVFGLITFSIVYGQGTVRGKVTDKNGESVIGAPVVLSTIHSTGTITDFDGNYTLKISDSTEQILVVSYLGFETAKKTVHLRNSEIVILNFVLSTSSQEISAVEITGKVSRAREYYTEQLKKNSSLTLDYISAEVMKKTGDANVVAAVARIPGISTSNGIITVRGIGDRYVKTSVNGFKIPTLDPFTNNFKLDLFPTSLVDNVIVTKTASPDLPGDWAGAYLSVETKDYPEELSISVDASIGYNEQTTFKNVLSSQRSSTDWLGFDNGFRDYDHEQFKQVIISPSRYQEFFAYNQNLRDYFNSMGITQSTPWNYTYFKLGLVQLGLLPKALFNDEAAIAEAESLYMNGGYRNTSFHNMNGDAVKAAQQLPNNWNTTLRKAPLGYTQSLSIGNQTKLFGKQLGFLFGYRYGSIMLYDPESSYNRGTIVEGKKVNKPESAQQEVSKEVNGWSALANLSYKLNPNNSIGLLFMPNFTGVNDVRNTSEDYSDGEQLLQTKSQFYEERRQLVYQFKSEHYIPGPKLKMELNASYTKGKSDAPDFKRLSYLMDRIDSSYQIGGNIGGGIHRYFRYLTDDFFDSRIAFELPIKSEPGLPRKIKFGGGYLKNDRENQQYDYELRFGPYANTALSNDDFDQFFNLENFGFSTFVFNGVPEETIDYYYSETGSPSNHVIGSSSVKSVFAMTDFSITSLIRFSGGLRVEKADVYTDAFLYDSLGYKVDDERRFYPSDDFIVNPGTLNETSYLPSANLIYKLKNDETAPVNLRLNFSQTVARPSIRELSEAVTYDNEKKKDVFGNSELKMVRINNYDARVESYFKSGDNISLSLFYKTLKNHIELVEYNLGFTWVNVDKSHVAGIEIEGKKVLPFNFELRGNVTLVNSASEVVRKSVVVDGNGLKTFVPIDTLTRTMYGQAPYIINAILAYNADSIGLSIALSYNVQGKRLVIGGSETLDATPPDIFELKRDILDIKISKKLGKHFSAGFKVRDILNSPVRWSANGWTKDYERYTWGTNYVLEIGYKL